MGNCCGCNQKPEEEITQQEYPKPQQINTEQNCSQQQQIENSENLDIQCLQSQQKEGKEIQYEGIPLDQGQFKINNEYKNKENLNTEGNEFLEDSYNQNKQNVIEEQQSEKLYVEEQYNNQNTPTDDQYFLNINNQQQKFYFTDESNQASSKYKQVDMNQRFQKELEKIKKLGIN